MQRCGYLLMLLLMSMSSYNFASKLESQTVRHQASQSDTPLGGSRAGLYPGRKQHFITLIQSHRAGEINRANVVLPVRWRNVNKANETLRAGICRDGAVIHTAGLWAGRTDRSSGESHFFYQTCYIPLHSRITQILGSSAYDQ